MSFSLTAITVEPYALPYDKIEYQVGEQEKGKLPKRVKLLATHILPL